MISFPCAKVNIGLHVLDQREDGYHNIQTLFYPIPLCDVLEIIPSQNDSLSIYGSSLEGENTCEIALRELREIREFPQISIHLLKNIPAGSGLGGGSSDAAYLINLIDSTFALELTSTEKLNIATQVGADCAFFLNPIASIGKGIGNQLTNASIDLKGSWIALLNPDIHCHTQELYDKIIPENKEWNVDWTLNQNEFEPIVFAQHPELHQLKNDLIKAGAKYASLTGTGSCVFGVFDAIPKMEFNAPVELIRL